MIDLCTLGTGGTMPLPDRALSSLYVRVNGRALVVDCGEGTQIGVNRLGWGYRCIEALLLTHYHADHCSGLPGLLLSLAKAEKTDPLDIWGPPGLRRTVEGLRVICPQLPYEVRLHELPGAGWRFTAAGLTAEAFPLDHGMPCLGYRFSLARPPRFLPERARALGVPLPLWKALQRGEAAVFDGRRVESAEVLGPAREGIAFVYAVDTRPVSAVVEAGRGAQLMILEGMYGDPEKLPQAVRNRHMLFEEAAALAREAQPGRLMLTHFSTSLEDPSEWLPRARAVFPATDLCTDGGTLTLRYPDD